MHESAKIAFYLILESNFGRKSSPQLQAIIGGRLTRYNLKLHLTRGRLRSATAFRPAEDVLRSL